MKLKGPRSLVKYALPKAKKKEEKKAAGKPGKPGITTMAVGEEGGSSK